MEVLAPAAQYPGAAGSTALQVAGVRVVERRVGAHTLVIPVAAAPNARAKRQRGVDPEFGEAVTTYLKRRQAAQALGTNSAAAYQSDLLDFGRWAAQQGVVGIPTDPAVVDGYLAARKPQDAPATHERRKAALRAFYRIGCDGMKLVAVNAAAHVELQRGGALPVRAIRALHHREFDRLSNSLRGSANGLRDQALGELLGGTPLRVIEALQLRRWQSEGGALHWKSTKQNTARRFELNPRTAAVLQAFKAATSQFAELGSEDGTRYLFAGPHGGGLSRQAAYTLLQEAGRRAGLPIPVSPNVLRHTFAERLYLASRCNARVVQEAMGHKDVETTERYLQRITSRVVEDVVTSCDWGTAPDGSEDFKDDPEEGAA